MAVSCHNAGDVLTERKASTQSKTVKGVMSNGQLVFEIYELKGIQIELVAQPLATCEIIESKANVEEVIRMANFTNRIHTV